MPGKIRVLIIDDSATVRRTMTDILSSDPEIEVLGVAQDPFAAVRRISEEVPDVITLDVEMPRMDGITFLRKLMSQHPIPVVMCSSLAETGSDTLLQALEAGAVDVLVKPRVDTRQQLLEARMRICDVVKAAAHARLHRRRTASVEPRRPEPKLSADAIMPPGRSGRSFSGVTDKIVCIGISTGGPESLREVLMALPADSPGIVVVQHMPEKFTAAFASRLDGLCQVAVKEAEDGDAVMQGRVLIAPGNHHLLLRRVGGNYFVEVRDGPLVSRHRPSVDVLFRSAAQAAGTNAVGIIMTGMGDDGAKGLLEMRQAGAWTVAQDEESCVVFGMPKEAIALGAAERVVPLSGIASEILRLGLRGRAPVLMKS
ncbi:MAG TPA: chemotaxis response regulator protein-glutamate methylesterase [Candidatus Sulfotelmatobacter sp.]|jgi:two-component system chemotaxis response regulator CheB|nr:chemotaxis response regulator protein-glutamate methylesterase [Candidatus Sulfotelmatobacter sp.]